MNDRLGDLGGGLPAWAIEPEDDPAPSNSPQNENTNDHSRKSFPPGSSTQNPNEVVSEGEVDVELGNSRTSSANPAIQRPQQHGTATENRAGHRGSVFSQPKFMVVFFQDVDAVKADISVIKIASGTIDEVNAESVMATTSEKEKELSERLTPLVMETNKTAKRCKVLLSALKEENDKLKLDDTGKIKPSELRIRENLCNTLTRKFIEELKNYQKAQTNYKTEIKNKVKRQVHIVKPDASEEEISNIMNDSAGRDKLYKSQILKGVADPIKNAYKNVADKYQDVLTLEASVAELHQMFLDFALLTEQQGEMLDQIEYQVRSAGEYIDDGNVDIQSAIKYQASIRKKQCCVIVIVLVILLGVLLFTGIL